MEQPLGAATNGGGVWRGVMERNMEQAAWSSTSSNNEQLKGENRKRKKVYKLESIAARRSPADYTVC
jgi:hypothetical protein